MRNKWKKPELVVLVRSRPEESVLDFCKTGQSTSLSAGMNKNACKADAPVTDCDDTTGEQGPNNTYCYRCCGSQST